VGCNQPASHNVVAVAFFPHLQTTIIQRTIIQRTVIQRTVISTEAAHGFIVSSAVEKSASLPPPLLSHNDALAWSPTHRAFAIAGT
jgi:hypothetical protein